jgi:hypothetical protein
VNLGALIKALAVLVGVVVVGVLLEITVEVMKVKSGSHAWYAVESTKIVSVRSASQTESVVGGPFEDQAACARQVRSVELKLHSLLYCREMLDSDASADR